MHRHRGAGLTSWAREHWVMVTGATMVALQLGLRAWALSGSWFQFDDFAFLSRVLNQPLSHVLLDPYAGHVMPGGFLLSWANAQLDPLAWWLPASELLIMQAAASVGFLLLLRSAFGSRAGILPPLALYLFSVVSLPAFIWWAAGVNQMPLLIAFSWGLLAHLAYLRTARLRYAIAALVVTALALLFYEKTLLLFGVYAIVALAYFASGDILTRLRAVWTRYRAGVLTYGAFAAAYTVFYWQWGLNFDPNRANEHPLGPVFTALVTKSFATGVLGGPLKWEFPTDLFAIADPLELLMLLAWVTLFLLGLEVVRTRRRAKRAWLIPASLLAADVLLVAAGRSSFVGPTIALDYRYQTELAAAAALALGLSLMPVLGAVESAEKARDSAFFDQPLRVTVATSLVVALSLVSSLQYAVHWRSAHQSRDYFATVSRELRQQERPVPLVDVGVPGFLMWAFGYPENAVSHVLRMFSDYTAYPKVSADELYIISDEGHVTPAVIPAVRRALPGPQPCGYVVSGSATAIPLDGPVIGGGWWIRMAYVASADGPVTVRAGERVYRTAVKPGLHSLYFEAAGEFNTIVVSGLGEGIDMCVTEVNLGLPEPYVPPPAESDDTGGT